MCIVLERAQLLVQRQPSSTTKIAICSYPQTVHPFVLQVQTMQIIPPNEIPANEGWNRTSAEQHHPATQLPLFQPSRAHSSTLNNSTISATTQLLKLRYETSGTDGFYLKYLVQRCLDHSNLQLSRDYISCYLMLQQIFPIDGRFFPQMVVFELEPGKAWERGQLCQDRRKLTWWAAIGIPMHNLRFLWHKVLKNVFTSRSEKEGNPPSRQHRSAKHLAEFLDKKRQGGRGNQLLITSILPVRVIQQLAVEILLWLFLTKLLQLLRRPAALIMQVQLKILKF